MTTGLDSIVENHRKFYADIGLIHFIFDFDQGLVFQVPIIEITG